jgi:hypothetical protein
MLEKSTCLFISRAHVAFLQIKNADERTDFVQIFIPFEIPNEIWNMHQI